MSLRRYCVTCNGSCMRIFHRSVIDDSQHSEICLERSLHRVMRFYELDIHDAVSLYDDAKSTELIADSLHHERSIYDNISRTVYYPDKSGYQNIRLIIGQYG